MLRSRSLPAHVPAMCDIESVLVRVRRKYGVAHSGFFVTTRASLLVQFGIWGGLFSDSEAQAALHGELPWFVVADVGQ